MWQATLDFFLKYFSPTDDLEKSTDQWTTTQLHGMLSNHTGAYFTDEDLANELTARGYKYEYTSELTMEWMFIKNDPSK